MTTGAHSADIFAAYAKYYDLLYRDKDYAAEVDYVSSLIRHHVAGAVEVLEFGCGTGMHALILAQKGYTVHGVDVSADMLETARRRAVGAGDEVARRLSFTQGDIRACTVGGVFDAVVSLFHVVSYQTANEDLIAVFRNAASHLKKGGVFIFDYWYGPAVLTDKPIVRIKRMSSDQVTVTRLAEPVLHQNESCVDVNYQVFVRDNQSRATQELRELHRMRYLFLTEIELLARLSGMTVMDSHEWLTTHPPGPGGWSACTILRA